MIPPRVRLAHPGDARAIADVHVRAWREGYRELVPDEFLAALSVDERERGWGELLSGDPETSFTLVAGEDGVAGFCTVATPSRDCDAGDRVAEVAATYVDPSRLRRGVGSALLEAALARLRDAGWTEATLWVFAQNDRARSFYARFGFEPDGARDRHAPTGLECVRLRARLA